MYRKSFLKRFPKIIHPVTRECRWLKEKAEKIPMLPIYTFKGWGGYDCNRSALSYE